MTTCRLCGGHLEPWLSMPIDPKTCLPTPYGHVLRCVSCRLAQVNPLPVPTEVAAFYQLEPYPTGGEEDRPNGLDRVRLHLAWRADRGRQFDAAELVRKLADSSCPNPRVCDIGCGAGDTLRALAKAGATATGVDPDPHAVELLSREGLDVRQGFGEALPESLERGGFDAVVMSHTLEHCIDPIAAVEEAASLLKPQGLFICETPNAAAIHFQRFTIAAESFDVPRHLWFFELDHLVKIATAAGLQVTRHEFAGYTRLFSNSWRATECRILDKLEESGLEAHPRPPRHSRFESWRLLAGTVAAEPARKYDSVRVIAQRP